MHICLFEDKGYRNLLPLTYLRPVYDLRCGISLIKEKITRSFPASPVILHTREILAKVVKNENPDFLVNEIPKGVDDVLFINGRILPDHGFEDQFKITGGTFVTNKDGTPLAARVTGEALNRIRSKIGNHIFTKEDFSSLESGNVNVDLFNYPWDLIHRNGQEIITDVKALSLPVDHTVTDRFQGVQILNPDHVHVSDSAQIKPGVVLDAEQGPIHIDAGVRILPNAVIEGPASIGESSVVKAGAKIYENTTIGPVCKVGGEVEGSIFHAFSNKQHEGFLGHAYLGSWVNLGADTNNSDLKNNYGTVKVYVNGEWIDSGSMFVGLIMGDHSKSGINTMFNTGTVVGINCNVYGAGFPPKYIPSFSWGSPETGFSTYRFDKAVEVNRRVMGRRDIHLDKFDKILMEAVYELTRDEREKADIT